MVVGPDGRRGAARVRVGLARAAHRDDRRHDVLVVADDAAGGTRGRLLSVHLLPNYDEYFIAYRDRRPTAALRQPEHPIDPMLTATRTCLRRGPVRRVLAADGRREDGRRCSCCRYRTAEPRPPRRRPKRPRTLRRVRRPAHDGDDAAGAAGAVKPQRAISAWKRGSAR